MTARLLTIATVVVGLLAGGEVRGADDHAPRVQTSKKTGLTKAEQLERDRLLDLATQYRARAQSMRDRADTMFDKSKTDMGQELADKADMIEDKARDLEEEADAIDHPTGGPGGRHPPNRPSFRGSADRRRD